MKKLFFLWLFFLIVYLLVAGKGKFQWHTTTRNYWSLQAYSWLHGRPDLIVVPRDLYDLSVFNRKVYTYGLPLPALLVLPFIAFFGLEVSDIFYTAFWASFSPVLLYLVLHQARKSQIIPSISEINIILLTLFFAFGTVFFNLSTTGIHTYTAQAVSTVPYLLSLYMIFKCVQKQKDITYILSIFFLCISFWGRMLLLFTLPLHIFLLFKIKHNNKKVLLLLMFMMVMTNVLIYGGYNFYRFGSFVETGLKYQNSQLYNPQYIDPVKKYGINNIHYFPRNTFYLLLNPISLKMTYPFINPEPEGNSIFSTSPLFILLFALIAKRFFRKKNIPLFIFLAISLIILLITFTFYFTGYIQFGFRYSLDFLPLLILSLTYVIDLFPFSFTFSLFSLSVIINYLGVLWVQSIAPYLGW